MSSELSLIQSHIAALRKSRPTSALLVGIGGHGASGKSTLAHALAEANEDGQVVGTDEFWNGSQFELDRLRESVVERVSSGQSGTFRSWNWAAKKFVGIRTVEATGLIIIEGVCALHHMFRNHYAYRIWVDAPYEVRLARGVARDGEAMRKVWTDVWIPNEEAYVAADHPVDCADILVNGTVPYAGAQ